MPISSRSYVNRSTPSNRFPTGLKWLLIVNIAIFLAAYILRQSVGASLFDNLALVPAQVVTTFAVWQLVTYMFLHFGISHILWNMLGLWFFGAEIERLWGTRRFLRYYFLCGIGAGLTVVLMAYIFGGVDIRTAGASGAIYGMLMAYALLFPDRTILFGFLIPLKTRVFVTIIGAVLLLQSFSATVGGQAGTISVLAHLGGLVTGYLLLRGNRLQTQIRQPINAGLKDWKLRRAKRKFEVYLQKKNSDRDRWVH